MNVQDITGGSTWAIAAAAFSNPMYLSGPLGKSDNSTSTGFQITPGAALVVGFEGTYTGSTVAHEQTMDPDGVVGWFSVEGSPSTGAAATSTGSTSGVAYVFTCIGVLHRVKVTALSTGTIEARIRLESEAISTSGGAGGSGGDVNLTEIAGTAVAAGAGEVTAGTLRTTSASDDPAVVALEAIQNSTTTVNVGFDTNALFVAGTQVTPKFAAVTASSSGDTTVVSAVATKKIRVMGYLVTGNGAVNWRWESATGGAITGLHYLASAGQGAAPVFSPVGICETVAGEALQINLSSAIAVGGWLIYCEV